MQKLGLKIIISISCLCMPACGTYNYSAPKGTEHAQIINQFATEILLHEFETTKRVLNVLERVSYYIETDKLISKEVFGETIEIIGELSHKRHQEYEDKVLFPFLKDVMGGEKKDFLGQLLMEHVSARDKMRDLSASVNNIHLGTKARKKTARIAYDYVKFMRKHLQTEEKVLFPWVNKALSHDYNAMLIKKFEGINADYAKAGLYEKYITMINKLEEELEIYSK